jgi:branched-chain amino acid transport system substrate-binding protein
MKQFPVIFVAALAVLTFPAFAADKPVVKIGVTAPLTGDNAHLGDGLKNGMSMAKEDLRADTKYDYQLVFEDDGMEAKRTAATTGKLINVDKVDAIMSISSGTGGVVSPIAESSKVIHFGLASAQSVADGDYNFIHWTPPSEEVRTLVATLEKKGIKTIALLGLNQQGFMAIRDEILKQIEGKNIKVTSDQIINPGEKDFRTAIAKAKADNPDLYVVTFFSPEIEIVTKQMREAGIKDNITSIEAFGLSSEPALFNGMWYVDAAIAESDFNEKFTAKYSKAPTFGTPNSYDVFNMLVNAYEAAGTDSNVKPSHEDVVKKLHEIKDYDGVLGSLTVDEKGVVLSPAAVIVMKDGKPVSENAPEAVEPAAAQ